MTGGIGSNLDADYVLELFNKTVKTKLKTMGPNQSPEYVMRVSRSIMFCQHLSKKLGQQLKLAPISRKHTDQDTTKDMRLMINELKNISKVFVHTPDRVHQHFKEPWHIFSKVQSHEIHKWLNEKKNEYAADKWAF